MQGLDYKKEVDIYSFGCFAYELATGMPPFYKIEDRRQLSHFIINKEIPQIPDRWSDNFGSLIDMCLKKNP